MSTYTRDGQDLWSGGAWPTFGSSVSCPRLRRLAAKHKIRRVFGCTRAPASCAKHESAIKPGGRTSTILEPPPVPRWRRFARAHFEMQLSLKPSLAFVPKHTIVCTVFLLIGNQDFSNACSILCQSMKRQRMLSIAANTCSLVYAHKLSVCIYGTNQTSKLFFSYQYLLSTSVISLADARRDRPNK
jgi:hypothetical protein